MTRKLALVTVTVIADMDVVQTEAELFVRSLKSAGAILYDARVNEISGHGRSTEIVVETPEVPAEELVDTETTTA